MSQNLELELSKQFKASQEKYIYFLLAAAASAIGFSMTQSRAEPLDYIHILLGLAILLWSGSFVCGLRLIEYATSFTFQNQNYLACKRELYSHYGGSAAELLAFFKSRLDETAENQQQKMKCYGRLQSWCLYLGALSYMIWHGLRMWALTT